MAKSYSVQIVNGTGTENILYDTYNVGAEATGYDQTTLTPNSMTYDGTTNTYNFTIAATGTLTLHVTEDQTPTGTPIVGATFIRTDSLGNEFGTTITTDATGNAVMSNVPFAPSGAPTIYFKQLTSDGNHNFDPEVQEATLTTETTTVEIENTPEEPVTFNLTDANYSGLNISSATLNLS